MIKKTNFQIISQYYFRLKDIFKDSLKIYSKKVLYYNFF